MAFHLMTDEGGRSLRVAESGPFTRNADTWRGRLTLACPFATCAIIARLDPPRVLNPDVRNAATACRSPSPAAGPGWPAVAAPRAHAAGAVAGGFAGTGADLALAGHRRYPSRCRAMHGDRSGGSCLCALDRCA